jgi:hypothetical protein
MEKIKCMAWMLLLVAAVTGIFTFSQQTLQNQGKISLITGQQGELLGSTDYGNVVKEGPYGNKNSRVKIAYIVGVHPLESNAHEAILESIKSDNKSLNYCYYIYRINVTKDAGDYDKGRINGQLLANKYVVPDIEKNNFQLVIDVHSNRGKDTSYKENRFLAVPVSDNKSELIASEIINKISWLVYYIPPKGKGPTSPEYITDPLINSGTPSIVYETYMYEPYETTLEHANEFIMTVDNIKLRR